MAKKSKERRRGKRRENRHERRQQQHSGGGDWDCIRVPEGLETFKPEASKTYHIDVIPYIVGGMNKNADEGDEYFELSYAVYNDLGIEEKRYIAIGEMLGVRDPVAEHFAALRKQNAEWDDMKQFKPKWRQLMLVFVHEEPEKGLQLFEGAYGTLGELLDEEINAQEEDYIDNFDDPEAGATLEVRFRAQNIGQTNPWVRAGKINFEERPDGFDANGDEKLAAELLDKASTICLDECLKLCDYATLKAALDGAPVAEAEDGGETPTEAPKPGRTPRKPKPKAEEPEETQEDEDPADEIPDLPAKGKGKDKPKARKQPTAEELGIGKGDDVMHDLYGTCTVLRIAKDGLTVTIMDENDEVHKGIDPTDLEPVEAGQESADAEEATEEETQAETQDDDGAAGGGGSDDEWDEDWED